MNQRDQLPRFIYSDLIKDYLAFRSQDAAIIEIYLIQELQKKFIDNNIQYFPRLKKWDGSTIDKILQFIDKYTKEILSKIKIAINTQGLWTVAEVNLSNFINTNVKYVNRELILRQLENLSSWEDIKFLNEERPNLFDLEEMTKVYLKKHNQFDNDPTAQNYPLMELKFKFYKFLELLYKKKPQCYSYFINCLFAAMQNLYTSNPNKKIIMAVGKNGSGKTVLVKWATNLPKTIPPSEFVSSQISGKQFEWNSGAVFPKNCPIVYCTEVRIVASDGFPKDKLASDFINTLKSAVRNGERITTRVPREQPQTYESKALVIFNANSDAEPQELYHVSQSYFAPYKMWDRIKFVNVDILDKLENNQPKYPDIYHTFNSILDSFKNIEGFDLEQHFPYIVLNYYVDSLKTFEYHSLSEHSNADLNKYSNLIPYLDKSIFDKMIGFQDEFKKGEYIKEKSKEESTIEDLFEIFDEEFPSSLTNITPDDLNNIAKNIKQRLSDLQYHRNKKSIGRSFLEPRFQVIKITNGVALPCIQNSYLKKLFDDSIRWNCNKYKDFYKKNDTISSHGISATTFFLNEWRLFLQDEK